MAGCPSSPTASSKSCFGSNRSAPESEVDRGAAHEASAWPLKTRQENSLLHLGRAFGWLQLLARRLRTPARSVAFGLRFGEAFASTAAERRLLREQRTSAENEAK